MVTLFTQTIPQHYMIPLLTFFYNNVFANYSVSIILVTVLIKMVFYPLTVKQFKAMKKTQALQPKVKELQEKYKKDPKKMQQEMMKLWKENDANPFGGCLPALVQLPVFFAIFYTVRSKAFLSILAQDGIHQQFFWLTNLAHPDPFYIFPVLIGLTMYWSQKMMPMDPKQAIVFMVMPFVMAFMSIKMPGGVLLYWFFTMFISNIQQRIIYKKAA